MNNLLPRAGDRSRSLAHLQDNGQIQILVNDLHIIVDMVSYIEVSSKCKRD